MVSSISAMSESCLPSYAKVGLSALAGLTAIVRTFAKRISSGRRILRRLCRLKPYKEKRKTQKTRIILTRLRMHCKRCRVLSPTTSEIPCWLLKKKVCVSESRRVSDGERRIVCPDKLTCCKERW